ncbi:HTH-type transcriptional repressor FabR [subsurface metagenome]
MSVDIEDKKAQLVHRREEEILAAAKRIFAQNGFRRTKIDQLAEELNIGKGTIYRYFKDKKSLFLAVFEQGMSCLRETMRANIDPVREPQDKVRTAVRTFFEFFDNDRQLIEILMQVRSEFKDDYRRVFLTLYSDYIVRIQENLHNGVKMGVFQELDVEKTAEAMSAALQGVLQSFYVREFGQEIETSNPEKLTNRTEAVTALLLEGLLKRNSK